MKTLDELYKEVKSSEELRIRFGEAVKNNKAMEFVASHGCNATLEEVESFLVSLSDEEMELSLEQLEAVVGGVTAKEYIDKLKNKYKIGTGS